MTMARGNPISLRLIFVFIPPLLVLLNLIDLIFQLRSKIYPNILIIVLYS